MSDPAVNDQNMSLAALNPQQLLKGKTPRLIDEWQWECLDFCVQGGFQGGSQSRLSFVYRGLKITDQRLRGTLSRRQKCATRHAEALHHTLHHSIALVKRSPKSRANCGMADDHLLLARVQVSV